MKLNCTQGGARKRDRYIRGLQDDGETMVNKSSCCASYVCGCLGDGRVLLVLASGESYDEKWSPEIASFNNYDKDGKPISWCYTRNLKGA